MQVAQIRNCISDAGLALIIVGVPIGMFMNFFISNSSWSNILMFAGLLMIVRVSKLLKMELPSWNKNMALLLVFQFLCVIYFMAAQDPPRKYLNFHIFIMGLIFALSSVDFKIINIDRVISIAWVLSITCVLLDYFCFAQGLVGDYTEVISIFNNDDNILERFTMSSACLTNIICSLFLSRKARWVQIIAVLSIILDFYIITLIGKRTPLIISFVIVVSYLLKNRISFKLSYIVYAILIYFIVVYVFFRNSVVNVQLTSVIDNIGRGVEDMISGSETDDFGSAVARYEARVFAIDYIRFNFSPLNYIFGGGYMVKWLDIPILQAYLDMGIIGFFFYLYYVLLLPIISIIKASATNVAIQFASFNAFYSIFSAFNSGNPYGYNKWIPIVVLVFVLINASKDTKQVNAETLKFKSHLLT